MKFTLFFLYFQFLAALVLALIVLCSAGGHGDSHKKVIIHVPFNIKHHHHTHTVYKHIHHKAEGGHGGGHGGGEDEFKVLGYTYGGHGGGGEGGQHGGWEGGSSSGGGGHGGWE